MPTYVPLKFEDLTVGRIVHYAEADPARGPGMESCRCAIVVEHHRGDSATLRSHHS
mgnify:CR=1 FL=1